MSMLQIQQSFRGCRLPHEESPDAGSFDYFCYDHHYSFTEFQGLWPQAKLKCAALLRGWTWHINAEGHANIRIAYHGPAVSNNDFGQTLLPSPATPKSLPSNQTNLTTGTFGYIFEIPTTVAIEFHTWIADYFPGRIPTKQPITMLRNTPIGPVASEKEILTYYDLRNTCNGLQDILVTDSERLAWVNGMEELSRKGIPFWYIKQTWAALKGQFVLVEFLSVERQHLPRLPQPQRLPTVAIGGQKRKERVMEGDEPRGITDPRNAKRPRVENPRIAQFPIPPIRADKARLMQHPQAGVSWVPTPDQVRTRDAQVQNQSDFMAMQSYERGPSMAGAPKVGLLASTSNTAEFQQKRVRALQSTSGPTGQSASGTPRHKKHKSSHGETPLLYQATLNRARKAGATSRASLLAASQPPNISSPNNLGRVQLSRNPQLVSNHHTLEADQGTGSPDELAARNDHPSPNGPVMHQFFVPSSSQPLTIARGQTPVAMARSNGAAGQYPRNTFPYDIGRIQAEQTIASTPATTTNTSNSVRFSVQLSTVNGNQIQVATPRPSLSKINQFSPQPEQILFTRGNQTQAASSSLDGGQRRPRASPGKLASVPLSAHTSNPSASLPNTSASRVLFSRPPVAVQPPNPVSLQKSQGELVRTFDSSIPTTSPPSRVTTPLLFSAPNAQINATASVGAQGQSSQPAISKGLPTTPSSPRVLPSPAYSPLSPMAASNPVDAHDQNPRSPLINANFSIPGTSKGIQAPVPSPISQMASLNTPNAQHQVHRPPTQNSPSMANVPSGIQHPKPAYSPKATLASVQRAQNPSLQQMAMFTPVGTSGLMQGPPTQGSHSINAASTSQPGVSNSLRGQVANNPLEAQNLIRTIQMTPSMQTSAPFQAQRNGSIPQVQSPYNPNSFINSGNLMGPHQTQARSQTQHLATMSHVHTRTSAVMLPSNTPPLSIQTTQWSPQSTNMISGPTPNELLMKPKLATSTSPHLLPNNFLSPSPTPEDLLADCPSPAVQPRTISPIHPIQQSRNPSNFSVADPIFLSALPHDLPILKSQLGATSPTHSSQSPQSCSMSPSPTPDDLLQDCPQPATQIGIASQIRSHGGTPTLPSSQFQQGAISTQFQGVGLDNYPPPELLPPHLRPRATSSYISGERSFPSHAALSPHILQPPTPEGRFPEPQKSQYPVPHYANPSLSPHPVTMHQRPQSMNLKPTQKGNAPHPAPASAFQGQNNISSIDPALIGASARKGELASINGSMKRPSQDQYINALNLSKKQNTLSNIDSASRSAALPMNPQASFLPQGVAATPNRGGIHQGPLPQRGYFSTGASVSVHSSICTPGLGTGTGLRNGSGGLKRPSPSNDQYASSMTNPTKKQKFSAPTTTSLFNPHSYGGMPQESSALVPPGMYQSGSHDPSKGIQEGVQQAGINYEENIQPAAAGVPPNGVLRVSDIDLPPRKFKTCDTCRAPAKHTKGKHCNLNGKNDWGPCSSCHKNRENCKFELVNGKVVSIIRDGMVMMNGEVIGQWQS